MEARGYSYAYTHNEMTSPAKTLTKFEWYNGCLDSPPVLGSYFYSALLTYRRKQNIKKSNNR
jgi:hypothetical protein